MLQYFLFSVIACGFFTSCTSHSEYSTAIINDSTQVKLVKGEVNTLICSVSDSITSSWPVRFPVYQFQYGDFDQNGSIDLAVGVYKATRYDSVKSNRLFLFQVRNNSIIPLWLGSSVGYPIEDFRAVKVSDNQSIVRVLCKDKNDKYLVADYEWYGFGLSLSKYLCRQVSLQAAKKFLND
ncbi:hypothetical protein [Fulvivirga sediminis]|uniref:Uncharacterized protein n=1 Tax=Fulvivirga sediminis TaxID=2803949 RepID=A0A937F8S1_9BACT|nr:hypothetical protein [Fulvivirga sediminis]MBL3657271.1 hypothetical protein [Fulvivirga sediminis]